MGYQESWLYIEPQRKFEKLIRAYEVIDNPPRRGKDYNDQLQLVKGISGRVRTRGGDAR